MENREWIIAEWIIRNKEQWILNKKSDIEKEWRIYTNRENILKLHIKEYRIKNEE